MENSKLYFKKNSYQELFFISIILIFELIFYPIAARGDFLIIVLCVLFFFGLIILLVGLIPKRVWVLIDERGVSFHNIFSKKEVLWKDISHSYTFKINLIRVSHIKCTNGKVISLPITGQKAKEISESINKMILSKTT